MFIFFYLILLYANIGLTANFNPSSLAYYPVLDAPAQLDWPLSRGLKNPSMSESTANILHDLHADMNDCEMNFNTQGNYHSALEEFWPRYLAAFGNDMPLKNWVYTTAPPMIQEILEKGLVQVGETEIKCPVQVMVNRLPLIEKLQKMGLIEIDGQPIPMLQARGVVLLVRKENPKKIHTIWDLARRDIKFVTANPKEEKSTFDGYNAYLAAIATHDLKPPKGMSIDKLFKTLYLSNNKNSTLKNAKWLIVNWIHHRGIPWSIAYGKGDAAIMLYHIAVDTQKNFPNLFDIVPLGGTIAEPTLPPGVDGSPMYLAKLKGNWSPRQKEASNKLVQMLLSNEFTEIINKHGLMRIRAKPPL